MFLPEGKYKVCPKQIQQRGAMVCSLMPAHLALVAIKPSPNLVQRSERIMMMLRSIMVTRRLSLQGSCLNYNLERYSCFMENIEISGSVVAGGYAPKETRKVQTLKVFSSTLTTQGGMQRSLRCNAGSNNVSLDKTRIEEQSQNMLLQGNKRLRSHLAFLGPNFPFKDIISGF